MERYLRLFAFLILVLGTGFAIGAMTAPDQWYAGLNKPWFNPPSGVFAPVWSLIYILIAIAGWRTWESEGAGAVKALWVVQMILDFSWSPIFFSAHAIASALAVIAAMWIAIVALIVLQWPRDQLAAWLFMPYAAWVGFATVLNASLLTLNPNA